MTDTAPACDYDVLIVGGGMIGASLACALAGAALRTALIETVPFGPKQPSYDDRAIALSYGSRRIFEGLGLWQELCRSAAPIRRIHVSERGRFGTTHLDCADAGVEALGYVVAARAIGTVLIPAVARLPDLALHCPAQVTDLQQEERRCRVELRAESGTRWVSTRLLVAADGTHSAIRNRLGIEARESDYGQHAVVADVAVTRPVAGLAFERFTASGPLAMLPMARDRYSVIWTIDAQEREALLALDDEGFIGGLQRRFGYRLGRLHSPGRRRSYPLRLVRTTEHARGRALVIGNAAHTLHPIAGQGLNLGLRDVAALAQVVVDAGQAGADPGDAEVLRRYTRWRDADYRRTIAATDTLARLFTNPLPVLGTLRSLGLVLADALPPLKHALVRHAMGLSGTLPRLGLGLGP